MSTPIERVRALHESGRMAPQNEAILDETGWAHWWVEPDQERGGGTVPIPYLPLPASDDPNNPYRPYTWDGKTDDFIVRALNARRDIALLVELADAVKERRDAEAEMDDSVFWQAASDRLRLAIERANATLAQLEAQQ